MTACLFFGSLFTQIRLTRAFQIEPYVTVPYNFRSIPVTSVDSQSSQKKHLYSPPSPVAGYVMTSSDDESETELQK
jgi:hypothetical protein